MPASTMRHMSPDEVRDYTAKDYCDKVMRERFSEPLLSLSFDRKYWTISVHRTDVDQFDPQYQSFELRIDHHFGKPEPDFSLYVWEDGDAKECVTRGAFEALLDTAREHEPDEEHGGLSEAELFERLWSRHAVNEDWHVTVRRALIRKWNAISELVALGIATRS